MIPLDVNDLWNWYWAGKAQVLVPNMPGLDQLVTPWNGLMANDAVRTGALAVVAIWVILNLIDSVLGHFDAPAAAPAPGLGSCSQEPPPTQLLAAELKAELDRLNRTQSDLASELGVDRSYISHVIRGKKPFLPEMQLRCKYVIEKWKCDRGD
jgi:hypothetical protein